MARSSQQSYFYLSHLSQPGDMIISEKGAGGCSLCIFIIDLLYPMHKSISQCLNKCWHSSLSLNELSVIHLHDDIFMSLFVCMYFIQCLWTLLLLPILYVCYPYLFPFKHYFFRVCYISLYLTVYCYVFIVGVISKPTLYICDSLETEDTSSWLCISILNIILHWQDWCLFFGKHEGEILNHISDAYVLTVVYDCTW